MGFHVVVSVHMTAENHEARVRGAMQVTFVCLFGWLSVLSIAVHTVVTVVTDPEAPGWTNRNALQTTYYVCLSVCLSVSR